MANQLVVENDQADMSAEEVAKKAIEVASEICVFTNNNIKIEKI